MKISDLFKQTTDAMDGTINGALTIRENIMSKLQDVNDFLNSNSLTTNISLLIPDSNSDTVNYIGQLTKETFEDALNDEDASYQIPISDVDNITLSGKEILDLFNSQTEKLKIQEAFFDYCCSTVEQISSSDFLTRLSNVTTNLAPASYAIYTRCIDLASSPVEALKNFFGATASTSVAQDANNRITITDLTQYGGDAWAVGINNIFSTVASFFDGVWKGITKLREFFQGVLNAIVKVGKWLFGKAFGYLFTVYSQQGKQAFGYMDLPVLQVIDDAQSSPLDYVTLYHAYLYQQNQEQEVVTYPWCNYAYLARLTEIANPGEYLDGLCRQYAPGYPLNAGPAVRDIIIPSEPYNMLLRFGLTTDNKRAITMYPCFTVEETTVLNDASIESNIRLSVKSALKIVSKVTPFIAIDQISSQVDNYFENFVEMILPADLTGKLAADLTGKMVGVTTQELMPNQSTYVTASPSPMHIVVGLINYGALMSDVFFSRVVGGMNGFIPTMFPVYPDVSFDFVTYPFVDPIDAFDDTSWNKNTYRPYNKAYLTPCTVHYQTTAEEAQEVEYTIFGIVLAVTITVLTIKTAIALKNLKIKAELSQAAVDSLSWQVADNPTSAGLLAYKKARKKNNRIQSLLRVLGMIPKQNAINSLDFNTLMEGGTPSTSIDPILRLIK